MGGNAADMGSGHEMHEIIFSPNFKIGGFEAVRFIPNLNPLSPFQSFQV